MAFRQNWLIFWAHASEKTQYAFSNVHYLDPTRSRVEKRNAKGKARKSATDERIRKLEVALKKKNAIVRKAPPKDGVNVTYNITFFIDSCFKCSAV